MKRVPSPPVTPEVAIKIRRLLSKGLYQHQIASVLGINRGRVSEVHTGKTHSKIQAPAQMSLDFGNNN